MSFADENDIMEMAEGYMKRLFAETLGVELKTPLPRYTYRECMERFGSDKPDMRYGMEIVDVSGTVKGCGFAPFEGALQSGGSVRGINAKNACEKLTRKELDKLTDYIKGCGAKGLAWVKLGADGHNRLLRQGGHAPSFCRRLRQKWTDSPATCCSSPRARTAPRCSDRLGALAH